VRYFVRHHADAPACLEVIQAAIGDPVQVLNTEDWQG
jgi:hypothetical protein